MSQVVLITGVSRYLGGRLAGLLAADPAIERVIGVDTVPPGTAELQRWGRTEFVRADIRNPLIAKVVSQARVDTIVHAGLVASPRSIGGRTSMQEMNVIGTMQLLAAGQKSEFVGRVVLASTAGVYGSSPRDPAVFTEDMHPASGASLGLAKDAVEVESYVRGFARRRPDAEVTVLRFAPLFGPGVDSALTRYLRGPLVPVVAGFDPRLQVVHETDAVEVLRLAALTSRPGVFNVAAADVMPLSQAVRCAGRIRIPVPRAAIGTAGVLAGNRAADDVGLEQSAYLSFGRALDTTRLREVFGYLPQHSTADAIGELASSAPALPHGVRAGISAISGLLDRRRPVPLRGR